MIFSVELVCNVNNFIYLCKRLYIILFYKEISEMKNILSVAIFAFSVLSAMAGVPEGYYTTIDGMKHTKLKAALSTIISSHNVLGYNALWNYYPYTYYHLDNKTQVLDMYSDNVWYFDGTRSVSGMDKEHVVPKSWWGGNVNEPQGNDLYNVIPAESLANNWKKDNSLGIVTTEAHSNGVSRVGTGTVNGHSDTFFEPDDRYKGDFARVYFYMATCYPSLLWDASGAIAMTNDTELTLKSWIVPMLLEWSAQDPVDETEIQRNEDVAAFQGNRNPFIDYPELIEYIWGSKSAEAFLLAEHKANEGTTEVNPTSVPTFSLAGGTAQEPKGVRPGTTITVKGSSNQTKLYTSVNEGEWVESLPSTAYYGGKEVLQSPEITIPVDGDVRIDAYCTQEGWDNSRMVTYWYKAVDYDKDYLLYEHFDEVTAGRNNTTQGSSSAWNGNANFPIVSTVYQAGNAVKLGTGSNAGSMTSKALDYDGGPLSVVIGVKGWTTVEGKLNVSVTGCETQTVSYTSTMSDGFETLNVSFENASAQPTVTIASTAKRAFINLVAVPKPDATAISMTTTSSARPFADVYYTISGQKVTGKPSQSGIYIYKGRKVVVR